MARDSETTFEHQRVLQEERPEIKPPVEASEIRSFNTMVGPDELLLAVKDSEKVHYFRVNPDVALNLGLNLLRVVREQKWAKMNFDIRTIHPTLDS